MALFTSRIAVARALEGALGAAVRGCVRRKGIVAVGPATGAALLAAGIVPALVAAGSAASVLEALALRLDGVVILFPCGEDALAELPAGLEARGARVHRVVVYRKVANPPPAELSDELRGRPFSAACATSPAAARWLFAALEPEDAERLRGTPWAVLGPETRRCLESLGVRRIALAGARFPAALALLEKLASAAPGK
jgi:uroporphyrinogen-III synthase